jgi:phosphate starvation-inducible protein PhoH
MRKRDTSPIVAQKDKVKDKFEIFEKITWTEKQKKIIDICLDKKNTVIILDGPAGTAKTLLSVYCSLFLLNEKKVAQLIYLRSLVQSSDGETGYLTGDLQQKISPYGIPFFDKLEELLPKPTIQTLEKEERVKIYPVSLLRGLNFNCSAVILDEAQNCLFDSIITTATRIGRFSKLFVLGDTRFQNDFGKKSGFRKFCEIFNDEESRENGVVYIKLTTEDIMRSGLVKFIVEKIEKLENAK